MIDLILAAMIQIAPVPMQDTAAVTHMVNIQAARQARQIPEQWDAFTLCISQRESNHNYKARNKSSSAQGRYQFLDRSWRKGGAWNVYKRLIAHGYDRDTATRIRHRLMATEIARWRPVYQDILYAYVITSNEGQGWRHWHLAGSPCNQLTPQRT